MHPGHPQSSTKQKTSGLPFNDAYGRLQALLPNHFVAGSPFKTSSCNTSSCRVAWRSEGRWGCGRKLIEIARQAVVRAALRQGGHHVEGTVSSSCMSARRSRSNATGQEVAPHFAWFRYHASQRTLITAECDAAVTTRNALPATIGIKTCKWRL